MNGLVNFGLCTLSDKELLERVDSMTDSMFQNQKIPIRHIPARPNLDYDLLVGELINRFNAISQWIEFDENNPPKDVVLAACDTTDCGWCADTAWWNNDEKCWYITGAVNSIKAHLPYTHYRKLPSFDFLP